MKQTIRNAYYFPHDIGACNDPKLIDIRMRFGWKGIGMFWAIIEALHKEDNGELPRHIISSMIFDFYCQEEMRESRHITEEAKTFEEALYTNVLLQCENGKTTSIRVKENIHEREEKSAKARESIKKRWDSVKLSQSSDTNVSKTKYERNTNKGKENKIKENIQKREQSPKKKELMTEEEGAKLFLELSEKFPEMNIPRELAKFKAYWTETDSKGKERWRHEKFFDIRRRLATWFSRASDGGFKGKEKGGLAIYQPPT